MGCSFISRTFEDLFVLPLRNGLTRPTSVRGSGVKMVNMGEIFAYPRISDLPMERVQISEGEAKKFLLNPGDLLFARQSLVLSGAGKCSIFLGASEPITFEGHLIRVRLNEDIACPTFYYYFFGSVAGRQAIESIIEQVAAAGVRGSDLAKLLVPYPPLPEQRAIAHILGTLDDKIELNRRMNETLEAIARAIFKSWFVDFDPVRAKTEGRDPGLPKHIADLFPDSFEDSELGSIPNGWEVRTVGDLAEVSSGSRPNVRYDEALPEAYVPLWGGNGPMAFVPEPLIDYPILLTGRVGTLGSVFRITSPCWPSDNTLILRARQSRAFDYLFLQLKRVDFSSLNRGSTQPLLTQTDLKSQFVVLPPTAVLERFHAFAKELYERIDASESESRTLAALRDSLLPKLISGEMRVKGADILLEAKG